MKQTEGKLKEMNSQNLGELLDEDLNRTEGKQNILNSRGVESFTISTFNFSIHGRYKRLFDKLYEGSRAE